ncbi:MAG: DUF1667 domain-containing protein [Ruminococcaceae bacterium]|nr:DUF1667 domain-containing protein [Oscillospiraceae bacterium]
MERKLTCIICPLGCELTATLENGEVVSVSGNTCKRGEIYAKNECTNPQRTITSTVRCEDGGLVAVKTDRTIPKEKIEECMKIINAATAKLPVHIGDVIIKDVFGANIVATANKEV